MKCDSSKVDLKVDRVLEVILGKVEKTINVHITFKNFQKQRNNIGW